jgi:N-acetylglucosamine-6-sulfatase
MAASGEMAQHRPMWVQNQRNSWHGVEYPYHSDLDIAEYYKRYCETLMAVDESVGRVFDELKSRGELDSTLVIYMGDNGFAFGEHGLIDKRTSYEESMRVLDIMPTVLDVAGAAVPSAIDGKSWLPLAQGKPTEWRKELLYEYYWERNFPQTPTQHALRTDRYKFIRYQGIWDIDELYDLQEDPLESRNLIFSEKHAALIKQMRERLFDLLEETNGMNIPLQRDRGDQMNRRNSDKSKRAQFPAELESPPR